MVTSTTMNGHVRNGQIVLDEPAALPEGLKVKVVVPTEQGPAPEEGSILDDLLPFIGTVDDVPPDASTTWKKKVYGNPHNDGDAQP